MLLATHAYIEGILYYELEDYVEQLVYDLHSSLAVETTPAMPAVDAHFLN